jgi:hypothetical protein
MDDEDKKRQAEVLAIIRKLPKGTTIEEWNAQRFNIVVPEKQRLH